MLYFVYINSTVIYKTELLIYEEKKSHWFTYNEFNPVYAWLPPSPFVLPEERNSNLFSRVNSDSN